MTSHLAGGLGALRHPAQDPPSPRSAVRSPDGAAPGGHPARPWLGLVLFGTGSAVSAVKVAVLWRAAGAVRQEGHPAPARVLLAVALVAGVLAVLLAVGAVALAVAGHPHRTAVAVGTLVAAGWMTVAAWFLPAEVKQTGALGLLLIGYGVARLGDYSPARTRPDS